MTSSAGVRRLLLIVLTLLLTACGAGTASMPSAATPTPAVPAQPARDAVEVIAVTDGDTITVRFGHGQVETVRYIGIDTPETSDPRAPVECFGQEAAAKNAALVDGRPVQLERDVSEHDDHGRLLRYVWVTGDDGAVRMVNEELVKWGYAATSTYPPDVRYQDLFRAAEGEARAEKRGLWGACTGPHQPLPTPTRPGCDSAYPTVCIPPSPPDLDCADVRPLRRFAVRSPDPHGFDGDRDGIGC
jgi:micrococcal nuclease